jgi:charged multivesicular body protein 6
LEQAKQLIRQEQKNRALLVLKLRRFKDSEADKVDAELMTVLEMIENVEWEHANMEVLKALRVGTASLNKLHEEMSLDDVADLLDETNEAIAVENQINEMIAGQFNLTDNAELEKELAELMGETAGPEVVATTPVRTAENVVPSDLQNLPAVPTSPIVPTEQTSEDTGVAKPAKKQKQQRPVAA